MVFRLAQVVAVAVVLAVWSEGASASAMPATERDLTNLCCTTETSYRINVHAILADTQDRSLARLYKTPT